MEIDDLQRLQEPALQAQLAAAAAAGLSAEAFVLKYGAHAEWPVAAMATQLQIRAKWANKLPSWAAHTQGALSSQLSDQAKSQLFLSAEAYEQASSEATAQLKPQLLAAAGIKAERVLDLCGGLGIDALAFVRAGMASGVAVTVDYNDADAVKAGLIAWNSQHLGLPLARITALTAEELIAELTADLTDGTNLTVVAPRYDLIFADPSRRIAGQRQANLLQFTPDLVALQPALAQLAPYLLVKLAPQTPLAQLQDLFPGVMKTWVVSLERECKECLALIDLRANKIAQPVQRHALCLSGSTNPAHVKAAITVSADPQQQFPQLTQAQAYIYDPDPAIVLAGVSSGLAVYGDFSLLAHSHATADTSNAVLFSSAHYYPDFPGRVFQLIHQQPLQRKALRRYLKQQQISHAHVWRCQSRLSVQQLREQFSLKDGGAESCLFVGLSNGQEYFMHVRRMP